MNVLLFTTVRYLLTFVGSTGVASDEEAKQIAGAITTLAMFGLSLWMKRDKIREEFRNLIALFRGAAK